MPAAPHVIPTGSSADPQEVFELIAATRADVFWLDTGVDAVSGMSYLGWSSRTLVTDEPDAAFLETLRTELRQQAVVQDSPGTAETSQRADGGFALGWVGWIGYEFRAITMDEPLRHRSRHPVGAMLWVDGCLALDHATRSWSLLLADSHHELRDELFAVLDQATAQHPAGARERVSRAASQAGSLEPFGAVDAERRLPVEWCYSDEQYLGMIDACQEAITAGDAYLLCLTNEAVVDGRFDPVQAYFALRASSPSHHGGFVRAGGTSLLSASPERFLEVAPDGVVETRPIKGTRPRGATPLRDELLHRELRESVKERAENLMIVDLMRNDLGRICRVGSVEVPSLLQVESYAHVHQLVSCVRGRLAPGRDGIDALLACFPAGSMTGTPKLSATRILDRIEGRPRGVYSGAFGYLGRDGRADLAMIIRSIIIDDLGATIGSGGGITALSDPSAEVEEVRVKARALIAALAATGSGAPPPGMRSRARGASAVGQ